jgi:hypothetical protein
MPVWLALLGDWANSGLQLRASNKSATPAPAFPKGIFIRLFLVLRYFPIRTRTGDKAGKMKMEPRKGLSTAVKSEPSLLLIYPDHNGFLGELRK